MVFAYDCNIAPKIKCEKLQASIQREQYLIRKFGYTLFIYIGEQNEMFNYFPIQRIDVRW